MSLTIPDLLTRQEAAKALRMGLSTLDVLIREGRLAVVQPGGARTKVFIPATEIERLLTPAPRKSLPPLEDLDWGPKDGIDPAQDMWVCDAGTDHIQVHASRLAEFYAAKAEREGSLR